ncbi:hypothetical protein PSEUBRA_006076 [Kalmanozyma brasiliensis GHG001]|uniref:SET domain-containing protein n=1 Tax=Kalmanozyma brasiliensis (strain GHG001) TaxID=1365824 RepID=V5ESB3_KALBG|nr:uncharacterized protein PSEUBRA_006076 [Kalmanozyma brasiliensis GHG001]EST04779.1 hypothetical protein PSEUBRA_006076 [Kalmanozyma brasiliensis GHG001]
MAKDSHSVLKQNALLTQLLNLSPSQASTPTPLVHISDQVPAGRGLVFICPVEAQQVLLTLPADTLINVKSFKSFFRPELLPLQASVTRGGEGRSDEGRLSSALLLTLLLARAHVETELGRGRSKATTKDDVLRLFVQTLPGTFDSVPLTWSLVASRLKEEREGKTSWKGDFFASLLQALPPHSRNLQQKVRHRFESDWSTFLSLRDSNCDVLTEPSLLTSDPALARDIIHAIEKPLFLWAWHCVNSRCVFLPLGLARHGDNFTLAPMLDMANHTSDPARECKVGYLPDGGLQMYAPDVPQGRSPSVTKEGDECFITYGAHSNESLLSEYGFVLPRDLSPDQQWQGSRYVDVLVDPEVEDLLNRQGEEGEEKIELLQNRGYWGEFTLHPYPEPHPSHRLVPALRLAALNLRATPAEGSAPKVAKTKANAGVKAGRKVHPVDGRGGASDLDKWEETLTGYRDTVSEENERKAHELLIQLCESRRKKNGGARRHLAEARVTLESHTDEADAGIRTRLEPDLDGCKLSLAFVEQLLDEEDAVLRLVGQSAQDGVEW